MSCHFVPPYLLARLASAHVDADIARCGHQTLAIDEGLRRRRTSPPPRPAGPPEPETFAEDDAWTVHSADHGEHLPGRPVRSAGEQRSGDAAVDEAYAAVQAAVALFDEVLGRSSYDGRGAPVITTVHFQKHYDNAFWDGRQLVLGDGDGRIFDRFTKPVDVLVHELVHGVTQHTAGFAYQGESGALNESVSDVFASCVKQRVLGQTAEEADWLIGQGLFLPGVHGRALRSMAAPGTAYDDDVVGKDPQVGDMADYVQIREDNGGVHVNSGIPNRAFHLAATRIGGPSWEHAGRIWFAALSSGLGADTGFAGFARATVEAAGDLAGTVAGAWAEVGIHVEVPVGARPAAPAGGPGGAGGGRGAGEVVEVTRSGGFAGRTVHATMAGDDPRYPEVQALLDRVDFGAVPAGPPQPDRFVYLFTVPGHEPLEVPEQALTPELSAVASMLLERA